MSNISTKLVTKIGIYSALLIIFSLSPIGFITIGPVRLTTIHIPIIIIALIERPIVSFFVGMIFGLFSFAQHLSGISTLSFMFINPMVSVVPRALIGPGAYCVYNKTNNEIPNYLRLTLASIAGTMINTFGVLFSAYIFTGNQIYNVLKVNPAKFLFGISISNGLPEVILCSIVAPLIVNKRWAWDTSK